MPLSVMTQKLPSGIVLMPEWPCKGWPLNGTDMPVGRSADLPMMLPIAVDLAAGRVFAGRAQILRRIFRRFEKGGRRQHGVTDELRRKLLIGDGRADQRGTRQRHGN